MKRCSAAVAVFCLAVSWNHPGTEVGTGLNFPHAGCWNIHLSTADTTADLWLEVTA